VNNNLSLNMVVVGILFGTWPLILRLSGQPGHVASTFYTCGAAVTITLFTVLYGGLDRETLQNARWWPVFLSIPLGSTALILFNIMLAKGGPSRAGQLFMVMIVAQMCIPAVYQVYREGTMSLQRLAGFGAAIVAAVLLFR
jgi:4-amino-4-deoxy-L-arabinose transferase-like glycosyltransferase